MSNIQKLILTELLFFFSLYFLSCPILGGRGWLSPILLPVNQQQCLAIKLMKCFSVLPKISYGKIMGKSNIHLKSGQYRENGECINYNNDPLSVMIMPFNYSLSVNSKIYHVPLFFSQSPSTPATFHQQLWIIRHLKMDSLKMFVLMRSVLSVGICKFATSSFLTRFSSSFIL